MQYYLEAKMIAAALLHKNVLLDNLQMELFRSAIQLLLPNSTL